MTSGHYAYPGKGPRPFGRVGGGGFSISEIAADMSTSWREWLLACPDGDFARFGLIVRTRPLDSALRRGLLEYRGYAEAGQWQYSLTRYGRTLRNHLRTHPPRLTSRAPSTPRSRGSFLLGAALEREASELGHVSRRERSPSE